MYPVFNGDFDKRLSIRDVLSIFLFVFVYSYSYYISICPVMTISDKHVCKTKTNDFGGALNEYIN